MVCVTDWKECQMTQHIDARRVREQIDRTAQAVAGGHDAYLQESLEAVSWERRGLLGRLTRGPATERKPGTAA
jgi:hypothetical protein